MKMFSRLLSFLAVSSTTIALLSTTSTAAAAAVSPREQHPPPNRRLYYTPNTSAKDNDLWYYKLLIVEFLLKSGVRTEPFTERDVRRFTRGTDPIPHRWGEALDAFVKEGRIFKAGESSESTYYLPLDHIRFERLGQGSNYYIIKPNITIQNYYTEWPT